jgi:hypothetical protein
MGFAEEAFTSLENRNDLLCGRNWLRAVAAPFVRPGVDTYEPADEGRGPFLDSVRRQGARHYFVSPS